jgi:hypothetical protein
MLSFGTPSLMCRLWMQQELGGVGDAHLYLWSREPDAVTCTRSALLSPFSPYPARRVKAAQRRSVAEGSLGAPGMAQNWGWKSPLDPYWREPTVMSSCISPQATMSGREANP